MFLRLIFPKHHTPQPQDIPELVGLLPRYPDLVGVDISVCALVVIFLDKSTAVPDKHRPLRLGGFQAAFADVFFQVAFKRVI